MPHSWNAYTEENERRTWQRCGICKRRWVVGRFHEVYDLGVACNGQCKDDCCHGWVYACPGCTLKVAGECTERVRFARYQVRIDTLDEALAAMDNTVFVDGRELFATVQRLRSAIGADQQQDGY